ncbi:Glutathione-regulated potassium-efflux system ATP-binding protein [Klebsiella pneumoniae IS46]|nr:Glutathione-regulated potassium-efflux system ATP-binding protein [Klebsiella pneumoniae IS46]CDL64612.1 Glutathione-regulated potassium-efflux system ATP-binding protein [Klebsiella pneumoniae IS39]
MIVFSSLQIRRGVRVLLDNATATINPGQKVGLVGKKRLREIDAAIAFEKRDKR